MALTADYFIAPTDLAEFLPGESATKVADMIADVYANVVVQVPALETVISTTDNQRALVKSIMREAVVAYSKSGAGVLTSEQETAGPFAHTIAVDGRTGRRGVFTLAQREDLKRLQDTLSGSTTNSVGAVEVDLLPIDWVAPTTPPVWW